MGDTVEVDVDVKKGEKIWRRRRRRGDETSGNGGLPCVIQDSHQAGLSMAMWGSAAQDDSASCSKGFCDVSRLEFEKKQHAMNCRENDRCSYFARRWTPTREPGWRFGGLGGERERFLVVVVVVKDEDEA
ncbi:hypothetical protein ACJ73_00246 [Blastomyces percursus]|uniref:Uncharacterized protein n=1 Tax=Blastomyces percursus TaxID=1658174 RepID=A0A1J9R7H5_9EURO|nr:hypothetical protein ACJ73_00246 [Blastomyces percursus]